MLGGRRGDTKICGLLPCRPVLRWETDRKSAQMDPRGKPSAAGAPKRDLGTKLSCNRPAECLSQGAEAGGVFFGVSLGEGPLGQTDGWQKPQGRRQELYPRGWGLICSASRRLVEEGTEAGGAKSWERPGSLPPLRVWHHHYAAAKAETGMGIPVLSRSLHISVQK